MSEISSSSNSAIALQEFSTKIADLVVRKRKLEEARSQSITTTATVSERVNEQYRTARQSQLAVKNNEAARLERLKSARGASEQVVAENKSSVNGKLKTNDNSLYKKDVSSSAKDESQLVVDTLDTQERERVYHARLANDILNQQIFSFKLQDKQFEAKTIDIKIQDKGIAADILGAKRQYSKVPEDVATVASKTMDTPSLQMKKRMEKLVEMQDIKSPKKGGISVDI
jgi:hypothetical protein